MPAVLEPVPGWTEGLNGPNGIAVGLGTGTLKALFAEPDLNLNFIPVDFTANMIISAAWKTAQAGVANSIRVYNCCAPDIQNVQLSGFLKTLGEEICDSCPFTKTVFYPKCTVTNSRLWYQLNNFCWHYLPAALAEMMCSSNKIR